MADPSASNTAVPLPLEGIKVIELGGSVAAPYAGLIFAELGAEVVKIEKPGKGDDCRGWGPPFHEGVGTLFKSLNRNKRSVTVDLSDADARARLRKLIVEEADVLVQNMRAGHAEKLGLGADSLLKDNPRLVHASIAAFGKTGPLSERPGYDPLMQAFGGLMGVTGEEGRPPVRIGTSPIDMGAGMWVVIGVLSALLRRAQTGKGGEVGTSLYETALGWMFYHITNFTATNQEPRPQGTGSPFIVPYGAFKTADGLLLVTAGNDNLFRKLTDVLGHPEWLADPRFATNADRVRNRAAMQDAIDAAMSSYGNDHWIAVIEAAGVPCAPIQTVGQVVAHPQTLALDIVRRGGDDGLTYIGLPLSFDGNRPGREGASPALGADTAAILGKD